jgi:hypothetical protein
MAENEPVQAALFTGPKNTSAVFVSFTQLRERDFIEALEHARPTVIFELRTCPRFDLGHLSRRGAFQRFEATNSLYYDLAATGADVVVRLRDHLRKFGPKLTGPVMFFVDNSVHGLELEIAQALNEVSSETWDVSELPKSESW